jgi:hypothetical protein
MPFCPGCGLNTADVGDPSTPIVGSETADRPEATVAAPVEPAAHDKPSSEASADPDGVTNAAGISPVMRQIVERVSRAPSVLLAAALVAAGLVVFGLLIRPQPGTGPAAPGGQAAAGGSAAAPSPLIVGLTIVSPRDGEVIATKDVTVIGLAPPGLKITRDVSFGFDQHATSDGTGHWAMSVSLNNGDNKLKFRIGDDRSTEHEIRVTYQPPAQ